MLIGRLSHTIPAATSTAGDAVRLHPDKSGRFHLDDLHDRKRVMTSTVWLVETVGEPFRIDARCRSCRLMLDK